MLIEISCQLFKQNKVLFNEGLNVVQGDDLSSNSIGKSTLLMIVDFVFGGDTYLKNNSGAIQELGNHSFNFAFKFDKYHYFFSRKTESADLVFICDKDYNILSEIKVENFRTDLKELYGLNSNVLSFRGIVSTYSRVWGKENNNVNKPLQSHLKETESDSINNLIKLFGLYNAISEKQSKIKIKNDEKKAIDTVHKQNYVSKITKTEFQKNQNELISIESKINGIKDNLLAFAINVEELTSEELIKLKLEKSEVVRSQSDIANKIERINLNLNQNSVKSKYFKRLSDFIPSANEKKIDEIENFHNKIGLILKKELTTAKEKLNQELLLFDKRIEELDFKIRELLKNVDSPSFIIEKLHDLTIEEDRIKTTNKFYVDKIEVVKNIKTLNEDLDFSINEVITQIQNEINLELIRINEIVHSKEKKVPRINLRKNSYNFDHAGDDGTGKSYSDLIEFDLAILELTILPFIIHDSPFFKNIGDVVMEEIVKFYSTFKKQIFISIDGTNRYSENVQVILNKNTCIKLSDNNQLFVKDWRVKKK
ncbi:hypothetical protein QF023_002146 [Chryseobacterium sp. SLBN-27]|uniref:DUF2326 domain-containing protein n=1 Tax=Chryseobacterium sp. SLBN-27 TaxID=3042287 RepID=UPI002858A37A|nr:DUF2326 domain-containing protein [Chryseobacterium sp. SLBN-27]MDR6158630.1 hypothetical protein [Chryseobacterium sp. SLBN-27]